jgi:hypothetical protein
LNSWLINEGQERKSMANVLTAATISPIINQPFIATSVNQRSKKAQSFNLIIIILIFALGRI